MNPDQQKEIGNLACQMFDRLDFKGGELQAVMNVRGMLEGIAKGELQLVQVQKSMGNGLEAVNNEADKAG